MPVASPKMQAAIAVASVVLLAVGGYFGLLAPRQREVSLLRAQAARAAPPGSARRVDGVAPIGDVERRLWDELEGRLRARYPAEPELPRAMAAIARIAGSAGMELVNLEIQSPPPAAPPAARPLFQPPSELVVNPSVVKLVARHRYRNLVEFLEALAGDPVYVAVQSLDVKRVDDRLTSEMAFVSLRWGN